MTSHTEKKYNISQNIISYETKSVQTIFPMARLSCSKVLAILVRPGINAHYRDATLPTTTIYW